MWVANISVKEERKIPFAPLSLGPSVTGNIGRTDPQGIATHQQKRTPSHCTRKCSKTALHRLTHSHSAHLRRMVMASSDLVSVAIPPYHFIHVLDKNTNVTTLVSGPTTFYRKDHEKIVKMPQRMITITPKEYCIISNPVKKDQNGAVILDEFGQAALIYGDEEYRFTQPPFPLYPGEEMKKEVAPLTVLSSNERTVLTVLLENDGCSKVRVYTDRARRSKYCQKERRK
nr:unnamed protein product [Spirometra erinaceieuropaei]